MKVIINEDEWYPVYSLEKEIDEYNKDYAVEVDDAFLERYDKCMNEFDAVQELLKRWRFQNVHHRRKTRYCICYV